MARTSNKPKGAFNYTCCKCDFPYQDVDNFYKSNSSMYNGHLPICKNCLAQKFNEYYIAYQDPRRAMKRICMAWDIYYNDSLFDKCETEATTTSILTSYINKVSRMALARGKTFDTSLDEDSSFTAGSVPKDKEPIQEEPSDEYDLKGISAATIELVGEGFKAREYNNFISHYRFLKKANPNCDNNLEIFVRDLCYIKMKQQEALREDEIDTYNKLSESYRKTFTLSGLKATPSADGDNDASIGVLLSRIAQYTPEEYYKDKTLYDDFDGFDEYRRRFIDRPLDNLVNGTEIRDEEYFIGDDDDGEVEE